MQILAFAKNSTGQIICDVEELRRISSRMRMERRRDSLIVTT